MGAFADATSIHTIYIYHPANRRKVGGSKAIKLHNWNIGIIGAGGLLSGNTIIITIAVICIGAACGSAFSLSMMFFSLRSSDGQEAAKLSGMAQSFGYLIAAVGPVLFGFMHDITAEWILPIIVVGMTGIILIITGRKSGANRKIESIQ